MPVTRTRTRKQPTATSKSLKATSQNITHSRHRVLSSRTNLPEAYTRLSSETPHRANDTRDPSWAENNCSPLLDKGIPSRDAFARAAEAYVQSMSVCKQEKALITQDMFDDIWDILHAGASSKIRTAQFRFWVRKMFTLSSADTGADVKPVILHDGRPVAVKSQLYDIIGYCHQRCQHGGRDRTMAHVRVLYTWVPKDLVAQYVKLCPTCVAKRSAGAIKLKPASSTNTTAGRAAGSRSRSRSGAPTPPLVVTTHSPPLLKPPVTLRDYLETRTLPPLPVPVLPSGYSCGDPHTAWLSGLTCQPGPSSTISRGMFDFGPDYQLPPLLFSSASNEWQHDSDNEGHGGLLQSSGHTAAPPMNSKKQVLWDSQPRSTLDPDFDADYRLPPLLLCPAGTGWQHDKDDENDMFQSSGHTMAPLAKTKVLCDSRSRSVLDPGCVSGSIPSPLCLPRVALLDIHQSHVPLGFGDAVPYPQACHAPLSAQTAAARRSIDMNIDPVLLEQFAPSPVVATSVELPRKTLIPSLSAVVQL